MRFGCVLPIPDSEPVISPERRKDRDTEGECVQFLTILHMQAIETVDAIAACALKGFVVF